MDKVLYFFFGIFLFLGFSYEYVSGKPQVLAGKNHEGLIVGGYNITIEDAPWQAYLLVLIGGQYYQCGGSLISSKTILTAAHCLVGVTNVKIRIGSTFANSGGYNYMSTVYVVHPRYDPISSDYDFGIVKVLQGMTIDGTTTRVVKLPEEGEEVPTGTNLMVSGWGRTTEGGSTTNQLMAVLVPTVSYEVCRESYGEDDITECMICAGFPEGGKDSCQGDSGGPAIDESTEKQVGVVSFGIGCARPSYYGVYSNMSCAIKWIKPFSGV